MSAGPVLVIEDHEDTRHMVEGYLRLQGVETVGAANGMEGLTALRDHHPSVILLDLSMPILDGWGFRYAQQRLADRALASVPVVVLTALEEQERRSESLAAAAVLQKPIDFDEMLATVRRYYQAA